MSSGTVPTDWKLSNVCPIFKSGDRGAASNYRPISLLSLPSKVMERLIHIALMQHLLEHNLLSLEQFGFRPSSSTQEAILTATRSWHKTLEERGSVACIFFDLSKAFDTLPHSLIMYSLARVGVCGDLYRWLAGYLTGRKQRVVLDGDFSQTLSVTSQGSILGPLLFILTVDPLTKLSISKNASLGMFADDIVLHKPVSTSEDLVSLQCDVNLVVDWVVTRDLRLNKGKTKCMLITRKRKPPPLDLKIDDVSIEQVNNFKYLGVVISSDLSWSTHIASTCARAKKTIGLIYRTFRQAGPKCLLCLYKVLVRPILEYCCGVWDPVYSTEVARIERVQEFAAKMATGKWKEHGYSLVSELGLPSLTNRRTFLKLCLCRRILGDSSLIPSSVFCRAIPSAVRHQNSIQIYKPFVKTNYHQSSFFVSVIGLWNSLPDEIVTVPKIETFKRILKMFLVV